ncbi:MAG: putative molybdenum carrier protein [Beijerinckiaceae bacterium]
MKIVSGGQSGVDQAALDVAIALHIPYGGWVPKGGLAENFPSAPGLQYRYPKMAETGTSDPSERTQLNVRDSDATIVLVQSIGQTQLPGTKLTIEIANRLGRPCLIQIADEPRAAVRLSLWLSDRSREKAIHTLNIAGPRDSQAPGLYDGAKALLEMAIPLFLGAAEAERRVKP